MYSKDYYAVLGVISSAEDVVIRAAYKALAQRYHPDRYKGDPIETDRLMKDINEAYGILSDKQKKREYDEWYKQKYKQKEYESNEEEDELNKAMKASSTDWEIACAIHPDLRDINNILSKFSARLAATYRLHLLETKKFDNRLLISQTMTKEFLENHFGTDKEINKFAEYLVLNDHKNAAKSLNDYVRVLGNSVNAQIAIDKVCKDHKVSYKKSEPAAIVTSKSSGNGGRGIAIALFALIGLFVLGLVFTPPNPQDNTYSKDDERLRTEARQAKTLAENTVVQGAATTPSKRTNSRPGETFKDCPDCPEMVLIPAGSFIMGSPDSESERWKNEGPQRQVNISGFAIGETEVTQGQWRAIMGSNPSGFSSCGDNCPVENVSWDEAQAYIKKLIAKTGQRYRLPSEAEWEYAARAGTSSRFHTGDCITTDQANVRGDYCSNVDFWQRRTLPVGSLAANAWGLYDIHGNVWEWVEDCWNDTYMGAPSGGIAWTGGDCSRRVQRGGSWHGGGWEARSASRSDGGPSAFRNDSLGFRLARSVF